MTDIHRRNFLAGAMGLAGAVALGTYDPASARAAGAGKGLGGIGAPPAVGALDQPGRPGLMDERVWQQRVDRYLAFATPSVNVGSATGLAVQLIASHRDPRYRWPIERATVEALNSTWQQIDTWQDTRDFSLMYLQWVYALGRGTTPSTKLSPALLDAIKQRMLHNRYRYDDPNPEHRVDAQWYWSENHILILATDEYLAGQWFPDDVFTITGLTGRQSMARARTVILDWVMERARFGFFEWHSHVYMLKNITPLLTLVELADDPEVVRAAGMALDLCLLDLAGHTQAGTYSASRGRTYKKDKMSALDEDTWGTSKFLFDDTAYPYQSQTDNGASYLCGAKRYRPPQAIIDLATARRPGVTRERHGIFVDGSAPVTPNPVAPFGYDFADPKNLSFWWSQGAVGMWQVAGISLSEAEAHDLWSNPALAQVKLLADLNGRDPDRVRAWEQANHAIVNFGHLREANTYTWRGDAVSLGCVVDHRFGQQRDQVHSWIAAIDADALVFTTHPSTPPDQTTDWSSDNSPGYWTGEASMPRSAQFERTGVHIYQPAWGPQSDPLLWSVFKYRDYTHAYVPQDRFDEVVQAGNWTFVRKGEGFIALWSWRTPTWKAYDPAVVATDGMVKPFDLVADGGPDNVWIVEVGERTQGSFSSWRARVAADSPDVVRDDQGFSVRWRSPTSGPVRFGSTGPFQVRGRSVPLDGFPRHESALGRVDRLSTTYALRGRRSRLRLDFANRTRRVSPY
ncbi:MAG: hypothetical protein KF703_13620 [Actinobacteria bacterium]|nr:hypothetical protein [Actinomycetota bacterium]